MLLWYLARGAGLAAFVMLTLATAVGAMGARRTADLERRVVWQYVHRAAALCGMALLVLHIVTLLADPYADVGVAGLLPFGSGYRPLGVTLGVVAMYLLVAVATTGALRSRFTVSARAARAWRAIHLSAYVAWALAAVHFLLVGTDTGTWWARAVLIGGVGAVATGLVLRLGDRALVTRRREAPPTGMAPPTEVDPAGRFAGVNRGGPVR